MLFRENNTNLRRIRPRYCQYFNQSENPYFYPSFQIPFLAQTNQTADCFNGEDDKIIKRGYSKMQLKMSVKTQYNVKPTRIVGLSAEPSNKLDEISTRNQHYIT